MFNNFTSQARAVMALAGEAARGLGHEYIGTEHVLLGLVEDGASVGADVLAAFGVSPNKVRTEIERLVARGPEVTGSRELPLTPRARQALSFAAEEARCMGQPVDVEHLLVGLLREPDGVAGQALRNFELRLEAVWAEALKIRVLQMTIVERAVRPVRATTTHKRKMREELLAHLTAIYDQEQAERNDPAAAVQAAARRFGDPAALARELDRAVPASERLGYYIERHIAWRAPETVVRYALRLAVQTFVLLAAAFMLVMGVVIASVGWDDNNWELLRVFAGIALLAPPAVFVATWLYIRMRDAMWGAFGSRRSLGRVLGFSLLAALAAWGFTATLAAAAHGDLAKPVELWPSCVGAGLAAAALGLLAARFSGPTEIHDTLWACLDLGSPSPNAGDAPVETA